ncbi:protein spaetzle 4-like [Daphnia carinata]|uniref:protein spaetzle 4-like n=1 Tax=Daphnia carinata TaxID=120202 RepID=UPI00257ABDCE|nr:protein spaetzle 4-like [Daphnia carinata]
MVSSACQSSLASNMTFALALVFLCIVYRVELSSIENRDFSGPLWYPSSLFRFTRPSTSGRSINRPVPLLYGSATNVIHRPFNPFSRIDIQNKTDVFIPIVVTTTPATTTSTTSISTTITTTPTTTTLAPTNRKPVKYCNPNAPPPCVNKRFGFCISDDDYPDDDIKLATEFSELADKFSSKSIGDDEPVNSLANAVNNTGCVTTSLIVKPLRARNIDGDWRVIVQDARNIFQWTLMVVCSNTDASCHNPERITPVFCFNGKCKQLFAVRRLLAFDPCNPDRQVFVDSFKLPTECSCRLSRTSCVYKYDV